MLDAVDKAGKQGEIDPLGLDVIPDAASVAHVTAERLYRRLKAQMAMVLEAKGSSIVEWRILLMLRIHGELAQKDLVHEVSMFQAQVSRTLTALQKRGLVRARRSTRDGRVWLFTMTPAGAILYRGIAPTMAARKEILDSSISAQELAQFMKIAQKIARSTLQDIGKIPEQQSATADPLGSLR